MLCLKFSFLSVLKLVVLLSWEVGYRLRSRPFLSDGDCCIICEMVQYFAYDTITEMKRKKLVLRSYDLEEQVGP